jgi:pimeloyl-ACP methyl ester carboxylesterase
MDAAGVPAKKTAKQKLTLRLYKACKWLGTNKLTAPFFGDLYREMRDKRSSADYKAASPVMRGTLSNVIPCDLRPLMPQIRTDTLLLWGERDTATPLSDGQEMEQLLPRAGLAVVKNAGHFPYVDNPAQFFAILGFYLEV